MLVENPSDWEYERIRLSESIVPSGYDENRDIYDNYDRNNIKDYDYNKIAYISVPTSKSNVDVGVKLPLSKKVVQNGDGTLPDMTFDFIFEQQSEWEGVQYVNKATNPTPIGDKSVTITDADRYTGIDPFVGDLTGKRLYYGECGNVLSDFEPQVEGTYCYLVRERNGAFPNVSYTGSEYVLKIVVDSNKEIVGIPTITLYKDSAGKTKVDYTDAGIDPPKVFDEKQDLIFYNNYGTSGGTTPTGIMTNILPFIVIGGAGVGGLTLYVMHNLRRKRKEIS